MALKKNSRKRQIKFFLNCIIIFYLGVCTTGVLIPTCDLIFGANSSTCGRFKTNLRKSHFITDALRIKPLWFMFSNPQNEISSWFIARVEYEDGSNFEMNSQNSIEWAAGTADHRRIYKYTNAIVVRISPDKREPYYRDLARFAVVRGEKKRVQRVKIMRVETPVRDISNKDQILQAKVEDVATFDGTTF